MENTNVFVKQVSASGSFGSQFREFVASKQVNTQQTSHALYGNASSSHYRASYLFAPDTPQRPITEKNDSVTEPQCATDVKLKRQKTFHRSQGVSNVAHKYSSIIPGYNPRKFRAQHTDASNANKHSFTESSVFASGSFGSQFRQFVSNTQITHTSLAPQTCSPYAHKHPTVTIPSSESHKSKLVNFSSPIQSSLSETSHSINEEVLHMEEHPPEAHAHSCSTGNNAFHTLQTDASDGDRSRREKLSSVAHLNIRTACAKSANTSGAHQRSSLVDITCASHLQKSCTSHNYASGTESGTNQHPLAEENDYIPRPYLHTNEPDGKYESLCPPRNDTGKRKHMPVNATVTESVSLQFGAPCTQYTNGGQCVSITEPEYASRSIRTEGYVSDLQPRESSHTSRNNTAGSHQHSLTRKNDSCKPAPKSRIPLLVSNFFESSNSVHSHRSRFSRKSPSHGSKPRSVFRDLTNLKAAKLNDSSTFFARAKHDYPNLSNSLLLENSTSKRPAAQTAHDKLQNSIKLFGAPDPSEFNKVNTIRAHSLNVSQAKSMSGESTRNWDLENEERLSSPRIGYQNLNNIPEAHVGSYIEKSFTSLDASFGRIVTSTPKSVVAIDYSFKSITRDGSNNIQNSDGCENQEAPKFRQENRCALPLDLRPIRNLTITNLPQPSSGTTHTSLDRMSTSPHQTDEVNHDSKNCARSETNSEDADLRSDSEDSDWNPDYNPDGSGDEGSADCDPSGLNNLTIYEYFQNYQTLISDDEFDELSDTENKTIPTRIPTDLPPKRSCRNRDVLSTLPRRLNISIQGVDNIEKEVVEIKVSKVQMREKNKRNKEKGLQYTRSDGTVMPARSIKPSCKCKRNCGQKYPDHTRKQILSNLLKLKMSGQNQFLASHISVTKTARPKVINSRRAYSRVYYLPAVQGQVKTCKEMFMATYDVRDRKIRTIAGKKLAGAGIATDDGRMKNGSRLVVSADHMEYIKKHILSFPAYTSHYSRAKTDRLYLSSDLNVVKMHELYQDNCSLDGLIPVAYNTYRIIFKSMNLSFRKPKLDTCDVCDKLRIEIKSQNDAIKKEPLEKQLAEHQKAAQNVYEEKRKDIVRTKTDSSVRVVSFDLQKQLPTPYLTCGRTFYSRQLYTLNLTMFASCLGENLGRCYIWDETKARRGSQEIGSCLMNDLMSIPSGITEVVYYSDRCGGQNLNRNVVFMFSYIVELFAERGRQLTILHKFMRTGHSHMEVDSIHAAIEKTKKKTTIDVETPRDWAFLIASVRRSIPFKVIEMEQREFLSIKDLAVRYRIPRCNDNGTPVKFKDIMVFKYTTDSPRVVQYKKDISENNFEIMKLTTENDLIKAEDIVLEPIETHPIPLPSAKLEDLKKLMPYIKQKDYYATFLKNLQEPRRGRKVKNKIEDHFESDIYDKLDSEEESD